MVHQHKNHHAPSAIVVGGGISGLLAARRLTDAGVNVTVLDEPSTGLDPMARADLWDALRHLKQEGMTIILSTHDMEEAEVLCDCLAIIDAGAVVAEGSPSELIADAERRHQGPDRFRGLTDVFFQAAGRSFHQQNK